MKKPMIALLFVGLSANSYAGQVIYKTLYVTHSIVLGVGRTSEAAKKDAASAIPSGYTRDSTNAPVIDCTVSDEMLRITNGDRCDVAIPGNLYRMIIPIAERTI
jgi:hypothetical protein